MIVDNVGGHLMQHGTGGTWSSQALTEPPIRVMWPIKSAPISRPWRQRDNGIPFYVGLPSSTFDWVIRDGVKEIPIERRDATEIKYIPASSMEKSEAFW